MYYAGKVAFLTWLQHPRTRGSEVLYERFIRPFLKSHENDIDHAIAQAAIAAQAQVQLLYLVNDDLLMLQGEPCSGDCGLRRTSCYRPSRWCVIRVDFVSSVRRIE